MRRRSALKSIAAGALSIAGCQCIVKKEVPVVSKKSHLIDMYWDSVNNQWIGFEQISISTIGGKFTCTDGILFERRSEKWYHVTKGEFKMYCPIAEDSNNKMPKQDFINHVNKDACQKNDGKYYEIVDKKLGFSNLLYI